METVRNLAVGGLVIGALAGLMFEVSVFPAVGPAAGTGSGVQTLLYGAGGAVFGVLVGVGVELIADPS